MKKFVVTLLIIGLFFCLSFGAWYFLYNKKAVLSVTISQEPTKIEYYIGEEIDLTGAKIKVEFKDGTNKDSYHYPPRLGAVDNLSDIQLWLNLSYGKQNRANHSKRAKDDGNHQNDLRTLFWEQIS